MGLFDWLFNRNKEIVQNPEQKVVENTTRKVEEKIEQKTVNQSNDSSLTKVNEKVLNDLEFIFNNYSPIQDGSGVKYILSDKMINKYGLYELFFPDSDTICLLGNTDIMYFANSLYESRRFKFINLYFNGYGKKQWQEKFMDPLLACRIFIEEFPVTTSDLVLYPFSFQMAYGLIFSDGVVDFEYQLLYLYNLLKLLQFNFSSLNINVIVGESFIDLLTFINKNWDYLFEIINNYLKITCDFRLVEDNKVHLDLSNLMSLTEFNGIKLSDRDFSRLRFLVIKDPNYKYESVDKITTELSKYFDVSDYEISDYRNKIIC